MSERPPSHGCTGTPAYRHSAVFTCRVGFFNALFIPFSDLLILVSLNDVLCLPKLQVEKVASGTQK